jgi:hypothetical protein
MVSFAFVIKADTVKVDAVLESALTTPSDPLRKVAEPAVGVEIVVPVTDPDDGATESIPRPNAAITPSARRLKFVFVDIDFLSLVVSKTFSPTAGKELIFAL